MKIFKGLRLVFTGLRFLGGVDPQRFRRVFRDIDVLHNQQVQNRINAERVDALIAEVVKMRKAAEFFGEAAEVLARKVS